MVLEGTEDALTSPKAEEEHVKRASLTIEHIMPQAWREHWPLPNPDEPEAAGARDRLVHTIGNLTLVNCKLNPELSNGYWDRKREGLNDHSVLYLNKQLLKDFSAKWDEAAIHARAEVLGNLAAKVWPGSPVIEIW